MFNSDFPARFCDCVGNDNGRISRQKFAGSVMQKKSSKLLFDYWNGLRGSRSAPDRRDIDPTRIRDALANTFILESEDGQDFAFRLAGSHLCSSYCRELKGRSFNALWHDKDNDAMATLIRAVTEDHAVALVTFQGNTSVGTSAKFEQILLPLKHNGNTQSRILGALSVLDAPYWLGVQPIVEQRITGLRLIWPDDVGSDLAGPSQLDDDSVTWAESPAEAAPVPAQIYGNTARRYAHLAVIDGGRN